MPALVGQPRGEEMSPGLLIIFGGEIVARAVSLGPRKLALGSFPADRPTGPIRLAPGGVLPYARGSEPRFEEKAFR